MAKTCEHCIIHVKIVQLFGGRIVYSEKIFHNAHAVKEHKS